MYGLIFDVDGVIADTEPVNAAVTMKVFEDLFAVMGVKPEDFIPGVGRGDEEYVRAGARVHGLKLTDEQVKAATRLREEYFLRALREEPLPTFPGVLRLINDALTSGDFRLAIATSGSFEKSRAILKAAKAPYEKVAHVSGSDVKRRKPDPEIFLIAARRIGLDPIRCCVVEDAPDGVKAAKAAGAACIAVTNSTTAANLAGADLICDSLARIDLDTIRKVIEAK